MGGGGGETRSRTSFTVLMVFGVASVILKLCGGRQQNALFFYFVRTRCSGAGFEQYRKRVLKKKFADFGNRREKKYRQRVLRTAVEHRMGGGGGRSGGGGGGEGNGSAWIFANLRKTRFIIARRRHIIAVICIASPSGHDNTRITRFVIEIESSMFSHRSSYDDDVTALSKTVIQSVTHDNLHISGFSPSHFFLSHSYCSSLSFPPRDCVCLSDRLLPQT